KADQPIVCRDEPNRLSLYTMNARSYRTDDRGRTWQESDLIPAVRPAVGCPEDLVCTVVSIAAFGDDIVMAVTAYECADPKNQQILSSSVLTSEDDGATFRVGTTFRGPNCEVRAVCFNEDYQPKRKSVT